MQKGLLKTVWFSEELNALDGPGEFFPAMTEPWEEEEEEEDVEMADGIPLGADPAEGFPGSIRKDEPAAKRRCQQLLQAASDELSMLREVFRSGAAVPTARVPPRGDADGERRASMAPRRGVSGERNAPL